MVGRIGGRRWPTAGRGVLLLAAAVLAACSAASTDPPSAPAGLIRQPGGIAVDYFLPATGRQLTTGLGLFAEESRLENAMAFACMARRDFGRHAQPMITYTELYIDPLEGSPQTAGWQGENLSGIPNLYNLAALQHGGLLAEVLTGSPNAPAMAAAQANDIYAAYSRCQSSAAAPFARIMNEGEALGRLWQRKVVAVQSSARMRIAFSSFKACARAGGAPAAAASSPDGFRDWLMDKVSPPMPDPYRQTALIASELRTDRRWTAVFIGCAKPVIPVEERLQLTRQRAFLHAHSRQIVALRQMVNRVLSALARQYRQGRGS